MVRKRWYRMTNMEWSRICWACQKLFISESGGGCKHMLNEHQVTGGENQLSRPRLRDFLRLIGKYYRH